MPSRTQRDKIFDRIVGEHSSHSLSLPDLATDQNWLERLYQGLMSWLQELFKSGDSKVSGETLILIFKAVGTLLVLTLVFALGYLFFRLIRERLSAKGRKASSRASSFVKADSEALLLGSLRQALARKDFAAAGRCRWRLFLFRKQLPQETTPVELDRDLGASYPLLFGEVEHPDHAFARWEAALSRREEAPRV